MKIKIAKKQEVTAYIDVRRLDIAADTLNKSERLAPEIMSPWELRFYKENKRLCDAMVEEIITAKTMEVGFLDNRTKFILKGIFTIFAVDYLMQIPKFSSMETMEVDAGEYVGRNIAMEIESGRTAIDVMDPVDRDAYFNHKDFIDAVAEKKFADMLVGSMENAAAGEKEKLMQICIVIASKEYVDSFNPRNRIDIERG